MDWNFTFVFNSVLLGVGLAMDAFSVAMANGIREPKMRAGKMCGIAGIFGIFQGLMPLLGWLCIHTVVQYFEAFQDWIPWIALGLLGYIGGKMVWESLGEDSDGCPVIFSIKELFVLAVATSIDALAVGITFAFLQVAIGGAMAIIGCTTFVLSVIGVVIGNKFGSRYKQKAELTGGVILILIGLKILLEHTGILVL